MLELERRARAEPVGCAVGADLDVQLSALETEWKGNPVEGLGKPRGEGEPATVLSSAGEARDDGDPPTRQCGKVQAVGGVAMDVLVVEQRCLGQVVVSELDVADLGGEH